MTRARLNAILEGSDATWGPLAQKIIGGAIILSAVVITLESLPEVKGHYAGFLAIAEYVFLAMFLAEFVFRLISAPEPLRYLFSFWGVVDFLACIPALLLVWPDLQSLRVIRLFRLLRVLKLLRLGHAFDRLSAAVLTVRHEILAVLMVAVLMLYLAAVGIYHFERNAQPEAFTSIPESLWWALATLTTVGYGDVYPVTAGGRIFTGLVLLIGLGIVALPTGLLTSALLSPKRDTKTEQDTHQGREDP
ncbi:hypothetical protein ATO6_13045 [Oceanicola sp. 22II-s10i]|uniref:ion transporter n=1 Tax=Oceanicola sp. 22II-s10i TaxID=1317116 RepID=UPI000B524CE1|nr:ion transporter [Oceanicola sp. 22II-s10i]OWU84588.1 hypothetical protein ATO6_13045 [Oceanicola sp. 22II-s10i]